MANSFYVPPANPLAALMAGVGAYDSARERTKEGEQEQAYRDLGDRIAAGGSIDNSVLGKIYGLGPKAGPMLNAAIGLRKNQDEAAASVQFMQQFGGGVAPAGVPAAGSSTTMLPPTDNPQPRGMIPGYNGEPARPKVASSPTVMGDDEAIAAGIYDQPPGGSAPQSRRIAQTVAPTGPAPQQPSSGLTPRAQQLIIQSASPHLPAAQRDIAKTLLTSELDNAKLTPDQRNYAAYAAEAVRNGERPMPFINYQMTLKRSGAASVNVDTKGEGAFETEFGKIQAKRLAGYIDAGEQAQSKLSDINTMREISRRLGSQGAAAGLKEALGPYAEALGVPVDGLSDIQVFSGIVQKMAPQMHVPGSGAQSDIEFKGLLKALPGLVQNPEAREALMDMFEASARHDLARGDIASRLATGEIKRGQAEKELRGLGDPMANFRKWRNANPQIYGQALSQGVRAGPDASAPRLPGQQPGAPSRPQAGAVPAEVRSRPLAEQMRMAPDNSVVTVEGKRMIKQGGEWRAFQ